MTATLQRNPFLNRIADRVFSSAFLMGVEFGVMMAEKGHNLQMALAAGKKALKKGENKG